MGSLALMGSRTGDALAFCVRHQRGALVIEEKPRHHRKPSLKELIFTNWPGSKPPVGTGLFASLLHAPGTRGRRLAAGIFRKSANLRLLPLDRGTELSHRSHVFFVRHTRQ